MGKVFVLGSFNMDMIFRAPRIPRPGETLLGGEFLTAHGGKGANQAVAAARLGGDVIFACHLGSDAFGDQALESFSREKMDTSFITRDEVLATGTAAIIVDRQGENCIVVAPGANQALTPEQVRNYRSAIQSSDVVLVQLETPLETVGETLRLGREAGTITILNPAPAQELSGEILRSVSILTPNETETHSLTGIQVHDIASAQKAAQKLHALGISTVIITMGSQGAFLSSSEVEELIPAPRVEKVVDTTAAGDVFNGALASALSTNRSLPEAVRFACAAASLSVTQLGAQSSIPRLSDLKGF